MLKEVYITHLENWLGKKPQVFQLVEKGVDATAEEAEG